MPSFATWGSRVRISSSPPISRKTQKRLSSNLGRAAFFVFAVLLLCRRASKYDVIWIDTNAVIKAAYQNVHIAPVDISYLRKGNGYDTMRDKAVGLDDAIVELGEYEGDCLHVCRRRG